MRSMLHCLRPGRATSPLAARQRREGGQALVVFALMSLVLVGAVAIVTDISWVWYGQQRMQRAADAAALAGAVYLPGNTTAAYAAARAEATKNGFTNGVNGASVSPIQDTANRRRLIVTVSGGVDSFFAKALGILSFDTGAISRAEYVLPVPMGSPENYYGVGYYVASSSETNDVVNSSSGNSNWRAATTYVPNGGSGNWTNPSRVASNDNLYAVSAAAVSSPQVFDDFGFLTGGTPPLPNLASNQAMTITGIELEHRSQYTSSGSGTSNCVLRAELSWDGGTSWSSPRDYTLTGSEVARLEGSTSSTAVWGAHTWVRDDFADLHARLTFRRGSGCGSTKSAQVDQLRMRVSYSIATTTQVTTYSNDGVQDLVGPNGESIRRQGFWGSMQSQGAPNIQGDAFMTYYNTRTGVANGSYDPDAYYQYGVEIPAGASNGKVWVYDPGFCDVTTSLGTGENWTIGGANGASSAQPVSSFFDLYDTRNTPYDVADDLLVSSFNNDYRRISYEDKVARNAGGAGSVVTDDCRDLVWHDDWVLLASGLTGGSAGRTYRLHTYSTDPSSSTDQNSTTALNSFAFFANASGGTPKVYGIGAMEAYVRLPGGTSTEFYMSQIDAVHAGKTMIIELWDPGDTGNLSASLQILKPGSSNYVPANFSYTAAQGSNAASSCNSRTGTNVTSVTTNTGGSSLFNGCWLSITIPLPTNYDAPHPSSDTTTNEGGWWKIRYTMGSGGSGYATDLTTWKVSIRGNPVHLVLP